MISLSKIRFAFILTLSIACLGIQVTYSQNQNLDMSSLTTDDLSASCPTNFTMHNGSTLTMFCYCSPEAITGTVWGTDIYTSDSNICKAAQHAGAITSAGWRVVVKGAVGQPSYQGSTRNGVDSVNYSSYGWSFFFPGYGVSVGTPPTVVTPPPSIATHPVIDSGSLSLITDWTVDIGTIVITDNHIETAPPGDSSTSMYVAPSSWHGNWSNTSFLSFDKKSWGGYYYMADEGDVVLTNGSLIGRYTIAEHHDGEWYSYTIPLYDDGHWNYEGGATNLTQILTNVTDFQIRAEYGSGTDHSALANVRLDSNQVLSPNPPVIDSGSLSPITDWTVDIGTIVIKNNHVQTSPPSDSSTSMYIAPSGWHGNWSNYSFLTFDKDSWGGSYYIADEGDVVLKNGLLTARYTIPEHHSDSTHSYRVPLYDDGNWVYDDGTTNLDQILTNITNFQIRAEYGNGTDHSVLANVFLE